MGLQAVVDKVEEMVEQRVHCLLSSHFDQKLVEISALIDKKINEHQQQTESVLNSLKTLQVAAAQNCHSR